MKNKIALLILLLVTAPMVWADKGHLYHSSAPHEWKVLNEGPAAFVQRLEMVKRARKTIDFEYFMYNLDETAKIMTLALIEKAREGVRVRMLIDKSPYLAITDFEVSELLKAGIEVRYYNNRSMLMVNSYQFRDHKKVLIVDDKEALIGGRNLGDEYFFNYAHHNYNDRDVWIRGRIVSKMSRVFEDFWNHKIVTDAKILRAPRVSHRFGRHHRGRMQERLSVWKKYASLAKKFVKPTSEIDEVKVQLNEIGKRQLENSPVFVCDDVVYVSDGPGMEKSARFMGKYLYERIATIEDNVTIESPYFITLKKEKELYTKLLEENKKVVLFTNSVRSTDNLLIVSHFNHRIDYYTKRGLEAYIHNGGPIDDHHDIPKAESLEHPWGTHAKTFVFDNKDTLIGSYNLDPRSFDFSAENALVCQNNPEIAAYVSENIRRRIERGGLKLDENGTPEGHEDLLMGVGVYKRFQYVTSNFFANLFDFWL